MGMEDGLSNVTEDARFFWRDAMANEGMKNFAHDILDLCRGGKVSGDFSEFCGEGVVAGGSAGERARSVTFAEEGVRQGGVSAGPARTGFVGAAGVRSR